MQSGLAYGRVLPSAEVTAAETLSPATAYLKTLAQFRKPLSVNRATPR